MGNQGLSNGDICRECCQKEIEGIRKNGSTVEPIAVSPETSTLGPVDAGKALFWSLILPSLAAVLLRLPEEYVSILTVIGPLMVAVFITWRKKLSQNQVFYLDCIWRHDFWYLAILAWGYQSVVLLLVQGIDWICKGRIRQWIDLFPSHDMPGSLIQAMLLVVILVPITEELLFRGFCMTAFSEWGDGWAVIFPGFVFALMHHPAGMLGAFVISVVAGVCVLHYKSIIPAVFVHACGNLFAVLLLGLNKFLEPPFKDVLYMGIRIVAIVAMVVFRSRIAWIWHEFRRLWPEFTEKPQFGVRFKTLLKNWSWILVFILLGLSALGVVLVSILKKTS